MLCTQKSFAAGESAFTHILTTFTRLTSILHVQIPHIFFRQQMIFTTVMIMRQLYSTFVCLFVCLFVFSMQKKLVVGNQFIARKGMRRFQQGDPFKWRGHHFRSKRQNLHSVLLDSLMLTARVLVTKATLVPCLPDEGRHYSFNHHKSNCAMLTTRHLDR